MMRFLAVILLIFFLFPGCTDYPEEEKEKIFGQYYNYSQDLQEEYGNFSLIQSKYAKIAVDGEFLEYSEEYLLQTQRTRDFIKHFSSFLIENRRILKSMGIEPERELKTLETYENMLDSGGQKIKQKLAALNFRSKEDEKKRDEILSRFTIIDV